MSITPSRPAILVVEDEPTILEIIARLLEEEGYQALRASDGDSALAILEDAEPDLIVSDIMMPGMDGFELCERVRATPTLSRTPFIFLTAKGERADVRRGMALGADDYLIKPFEPEELLSAVRVRLARAAEAQAAIARVGSELQDQIVRTLTHEFRTPLSLVVGYTDLLESSGLEMNETEFQAALRGLHTGSGRLVGLVEDFLLLSQLRAGAIANEIAQASPIPIDPDPIVHHVAAQAQNRAAARNVSLVVECTTSSAAVAISGQHLAEIASRLLDNAIKFSKTEGGQVEIACRQTANSWELSIKDHGIGIRHEAFAWLFEAFQQVDRGELEQQGAGVGLAIVRGLVEVYGGRIAVDSTLGKGTTFAVQLPLATE